MRKIVFVLSVVTMVLGMMGSASADPIDFNVAGAGSSVTISNEMTWGIYGSSSLTTNLSSSLDGEIFSLNDRESHTFDFFDITINSTGFLSGGTADILATLAFETPVGSSITGSGDGGWFALSGTFSAGTLTWMDLPQSFYLDDGTYFDVDFEDICVAGLGDSTTISATVTAHTSPVPEPGTMLILGTGLAGFVFVNRRSMIKA